MNPNDILESEAAWKASFDKSDPAYHNGDPTPVPMGGQRIPESMKSEADWQSIPVQDAPAEPVSYGAEYDAVMNRRTMLGEFKKAIEKIAPSIEIAVKCREAMSKPGVSAEEMEKLNAGIADSNMKRDAAITAVLAFEAQFADADESSIAKRRLITTVTEKAVQPMTREQYGDFFLEVKRYTSGIFNEQKALLEKLKQIKKSYVKVPQ